MNILVTGARGFVGRNLCERLKTIRDGKDHTHPELNIDEVYECDRKTAPETLRQYCQDADFVFHLAGVNRPENPEEYQTGNAGFTSELLDILASVHNTCPLMLASSVQASLTGRYRDSDYGRSKLDSEHLFFQHAVDTGADVFVYRFPNLFGKWCRPDYNSAVATFCYNIAHDLPVKVSDRGTQLELLYIDDLVEEMLGTLNGKASHCSYYGQDLVADSRGFFCYVPTTYIATLGEIVEQLNEFHDQPQTLVMPEQPKNSFREKLYAAYLSYLPKDKISFPLTMNQDDRGSFTELIKSEACGQVSVNISKPGITKGQHWHNTKWEFFIVVSGHGLIQERKIGSDEILEFEVSGDDIKAVHMLPGYTHNIINQSDSEDLITIMWANESFDGSHPDTYAEEV